MAAKKPVSKAGAKRVSAKISKLHKMEPEMSHKAMVGMAMGMEHAGRLGPKGAYRPVKKAKPVHKVAAKRTVAKGKR